MKKLFFKTISILFLATMICSFSIVPTFASETTLDKEYSLKSTSTWGDVYNYFDPNGFNKLSKSEKELYNTIPIDKENEVASFMLKDNGNIFSDCETTISTNGYIYSNNAQNNLALTSIDINGLTNMTMGLSSSKNSIDYTTVLLSSISCPKLYINMSLYDASRNKLIFFKNFSRTNGMILTADDTFKNLKSNTKYQILAIGTVTPPSGYISSGPLYLQQNKSTKSK